MDSYKTLSQYASIEFVERKSIFLGYANNACNESEAIDFINTIRKKHSDATHNVYAYSLRENNTMRFSDDGEPQGTAGLPSLEILRKGEIVDAVVVVTRYFGGIMLGAGGLIRAYSTTAKLAVEAAQIKLMKLHKIFKATVDYSSYPKIADEFEKQNVVVVKTNFAENVIIEYAMVTEQEERVNNKVQEITNGRAEILFCGTEYYLV